jgi:D-cysteine desulfhydrase
LSNALFDRFPTLRDRLPWIPLATVPTPIEELPSPEGFRGRLFVKRDDLTSPLYGGNKVRKFEYLLADARRRGARALVTVGGIGSNQGLAATLHGAALGFAVDLSLGWQPITEAVELALRGMVAAGARIRYAAGPVGMFANAAAAMRARRRAGEIPYYIPFGATNALGSAGYVGAALELAAQIRAGEVPAPDRLFVPAGTCGTAAGLLVGCRVAGLRTRVTAVRVVARPLANTPLLLWRARRVAALLARLDPTVPRVRIGRHEIDLIGDFVGEGYGAPTRESEQALAWAAPRLRLETTYSGKALAACLTWCRDRAAGETVLFWNTHNSASFPTVQDLGGLSAPLQALLAGR